MKTKREKILVVDDYPHILMGVKMALETDGYEVITASDGVMALEKVYKEKPDLIILDLILPKKDGYAVCEELKRNPKTELTPIIMLTAKGKIDEKIEGIEIGADDYIVKPFEPAELRARVKMILRRSKQERDVNPLTGLPGNLLIEERVKYLIERNSPFTVLYLDIDNFKSFNDYYGYSRGDEVIKLSARLFTEICEELGNPDDLVGHIGGDDFIIVTTPKKAKSISARIIKVFDESILSLYDEEDLKRGYLMVKDRRGNPSFFPIMSISIVGVSNARRKIFHYGQLGAIAAELKKYAKSLEGSNYVEDRRSG
jgi:diguanylate cyclase (GGDEF)-like protein